MKEEDITCISYKNEIKNWLEKCLKRSVNFPLLRETISQYIYLIKYLTNQTINEKMKNELIDLIIKDQEYTKAAEEIFKVWEFCKFKIIDNLKPEIKKIADELNLESEIDNEKLGDKDSAFCFFKADSPISIIFYFESKLDNLLVGIGINEKHASDELNLKLKSHFANFTFKDKLNYPNWIWVEKFSAWEETPWEEINAKIPEEIRKTLVILIKKIEEFKP